MSASGSNKEQSQSEESLAKPSESASSQTASEGQEENLEDLLRTLNKQIKGSDWLQHNTADKWLAENPEAAQELQHIIGEKQNASAPAPTPPSTQ